MERRPILYVRAVSDLVFGEYFSDDGHIHCALEMSPDTFAVMGFSTPAAGTPRRPKGLLPRKQLFQNTAGKLLELPYSTVGYPFTFGFVTLRGDPSFMAVGARAESNRAES